MRTPKILQLFSLLFLVSCSNVCSQSGNAADFLPLQVGNVWVYYHSAFGNPPCYCSEMIRVKVTGSSVYNGKTYFQSQISIIVYACPGDCGRGFLPFDSLLRVDSASGKVLRYAPGAGCTTPNETLLDSLKSRLNDTIWNYCQPPSQFRTYKCIDTNSATIFGLVRPAKTFESLEFEGGYARTYAKGIGLIRSNCYAAFGSGMTQLDGCVINGVVFGDTGFIVGINKIKSEIPKKFSLSQNYPNPFNPTTKISFAIPPSKGDRGMSIVSLIIYDALGKEVATLVNQQLQPGTYEADWDGTNYPSGVYFYQLSIGNEQLATKKMLMVK